jgi:hypothetical protein
MAAEKRDVLKTTKIVPDIASLRDIARTMCKKDIRARTETVMIATTTTNALIASSGCRAIPVEDDAVMMTTTEIGAGTITVGRDLHVHGWSTSRPT